MIPASDTSTDHSAASNPFDWCEPLVGDILAGHYDSACKGNNSAIRELAVLHTRCWFKVLSGQLREGIALRERLRVGARIAGVDQTILDQADQRVVGEINDVIAARFRRAHYERENFRNALTLAADAFVMPH
ncbi:MAG: hypothetical protein AB7J19_00880 [Beijerinckiaceae bacterium]